MDRLELAVPITERLLETVLPLPGLEIETEGGGTVVVLLTFTEMEAVPIWPDESVALTVRVWVPFATVAEFHENGKDALLPVLTGWLSTSN